MIREYITAHLKNKLKDSPTLVVYDPDRRYRELLAQLTDDNTRIFDISSSVLSTREDALDYYGDFLPANKEARMVVYIPFAAPETKQEKIQDPFFIFSLGGQIFPYDASDKFDSLCKACFKDKEHQISELFSQGIPDFNTIDALGGGNTWAKLQSLTGGKSEKEILLAIMVPTPAQQALFNKDKTWIKEYKDLAHFVGFSPKEKVFDSINAELWRFILFSEFVFDLPISLPSNLRTIPVAKESVKILILEICQSLRNNKACEELYIEKAEQVSDQLSLPDAFRNENNLGQIITFSFEDNTYFFHFVDLVLNDKKEEARQVVSKSKENIWIHHNEERRRYWKLAEIGLQIANTSTPSLFTSLKSEIEFYNREGYKIDQLQRKFEKQLLEVLETNAILSKLIKHVRQAYRKYSEKVQKNYQQLFKNEQWPVEGLLSNTQVFGKHIQPLLKANIKTAYILVDAFRLELAKELEGQIEKHFAVQLFPSCAYLPTVTKYGMSSLLPDADKNLSLIEHQGSLEAFIDGKALLNLAHRKEYLKNKLGDRCEIISLDKLVSLSDIPSVDLLVITTNEIDNAGENLASNSLVVMHQAVQNLVKAVYLLRQHGYDKIIMATDHGFVLHPEFQPGDNVTKPPGEWVLIKSRVLAGTGAAPDYGMNFTAHQIGVRSTVKDFLFLKNYAVFEKNTNYFHEGLSLQENIVPVLILTNIKAKKEKKIDVTLTYKGKSSGNVTTRRPLLEISSFLEGELAFDPISIRMEAIANEKIVGNPSSDERVNETTKLVEIIPGQTCKIPVDMQPDFEGEFEIRLTDPVTNKTLASITLKTDYIT
jgi:hypothetical protein